MMSTKDRLRSDRVPEQVIFVLRRLLEAGHSAWLVGGGVRDLVRSDDPRPAKDWDVATSARPDQVMAAFKRVIPTGVKHGTVTVLVRRSQIEVTTFRGEKGYSDARRPDEVEFLEHVDEDLARRDFTMNAMAWNPLSGEIRDPFGGLADIEARVVRAVRDPVERFQEDGLRPMRAVRFACVLQFSIDPKTLDAIPRTLPSFQKVAIERVRQEMERMLSAERPSIGVDLMARTGLLAVVLPELVPIGAASWAAVLSALDLASAKLEVRLAVLLDPLADEDDGEARVAAILRRLRFSNATSTGVQAIQAERGLLDVEAPSPARLRRALARAGIGAADDLASYWCALARGRDEPAAIERAEVMARDLGEQARLRPPVRAKDLAISGGDVMRELGSGPGPAVGRALEALLEIVIEDPALNDPKTLLNILREGRAGAMSPEADH